MMSATRVTTTYVKPMISTRRGEHGVVLQLCGFERGQPDPAVVEEELDRDEAAEQVSRPASR